MTKVLVTGGRNYADADMLAKTMDRLHSLHKFTLLIHGAASGADALANEWASRHGIAIRSCPADWQQHGKAAGPIRNREMLKECPQLVIAFPGGKGTADMVSAAKQAGIETIVFADAVSLYLPDAQSRGLVFAVDGERLLVSPRTAITESDRAFIMASKPQILTLLASRKHKEASERQCQGVCPGAEHELCAGCCSIHEYLMPDGLIVNGWCINGLDVKTATHYRNRWDAGEWTPVVVEAAS